jgi:hypothetical protein
MITRLYVPSIGGLTDPHCETYAHVPPKALEPESQVRDQRQPIHSSETMKAIAAGSEGRERMLYVLLGATGLRFGEAFGLEIDKHISDDFSTLHIRQKVCSGHVQLFLKTDNGVREIDLPSSISAMLKKFVGSRTSGFVFCTWSVRTRASESPVSHLDLWRFRSRLGRAFKTSSPSTKRLWCVGSNPMCR